MDYEIRAIDASELATFRAAVIETFGNDVQSEDEGTQRLSDTLDVGRTYVAFDGQKIVGTAAAYDLRLSIPGGAVPMAGLTMVTVRPTHRRKGILRAMMGHHLQDVAARGEPLSGLWASEVGIYSRFDFGIAAESEHIEMNVDGVSFPGDLPLDDVEFVEREGADELLDPIYKAVCARRPGMFARTPTWWRARILYDGVERRHGASSLRIVVATRGEAKVGYLMYRQSSAYAQGHFNGKIDIIELQAVDLGAERSLWHFVSHIDLYSRVVWSHCPTDSALPWLVEDRRRISRNRLDTLWLRICDVEAALTARSYALDASLCLEIASVAEAPIRRMLSVQAGHATCASTRQEPDLRMDRATLSSMYLGSFSASQLARAGRVQGGALAVQTADRLFATSLAAYCPEIF